MSDASARTLTQRDWFVVIGIAVVAILFAAPGVHAFELFLPALAATIVSHSIAVIGLGYAVYQWRKRRAMTSAR